MRVSNALMIAAVLVLALPAGTLLAAAGDGPDARALAAWQAAMAHAGKQAAPAEKSSCGAGCGCGCNEGLPCDCGSKKEAGDEEFIPVCGGGGARASGGRGRGIASSGCGAAGGSCGASSARKASSCGPGGCGSSNARQVTVTATVNNGGGFVNNAPRLVNNNGAPRVAVAATVNNRPAVIGSGHNNGAAPRVAAVSGVSRRVTITVTVPLSVISAAIPAPVFKAAPTPVRRQQAPIMPPLILVPIPNAPAPPQVFTIGPGRRVSRAPFLAPPAPRGGAGGGC